MIYCENIVQKGHFSSVTISLIRAFISKFIYTIFFFFWFPTVFSQGFQLETNHCSCRVGPRRGKALAQKILFKVQVVGLELESTPSRACK